MPYVVVCYRNNDRKAEEQRKELGMTAEDYTEFRNGQITALKLQMVALKKMDSSSEAYLKAVAAYNVACDRYDAACILPEKYQ